MLLEKEAADEVLGRINASEKEREVTRECVKEGNLLKANSAGRIERRKIRVLSDQSLTSIIGEENRNALASGPVSEAPEEAQKAFEAQIGGKDTQPCWFLTRGTEIRRTVGRIHIRDNFRRFGWGTGFLVAPNLLLTNHHVLDSIDRARFSRVEFDFEETFTGDVMPTATFDLVPDVFFVSSPARDGLDYALVAVNSKARSDSRLPNANLSDYGFNTLIKEEGKLMKGELIYCIHHPEGQGRQVNLRENTLTAIDTPALNNIWMHYETDTEVGSSGAPLFNYEWVVVGVHHMAVEKRDDQGRILAIGGGLWTTEMGNKQKWWDVNEGLRISRFIKDVQERVKRILESDDAQDNQKVSEQGFALFETMLKPSQSIPVQPNPIVTPSHTSIPLPGGNPE